MRILGVDPGSARVGYGLITDKPLRLIAHGIIDIKEKHPHRRLQQLADAYEALLIELKPEVVAIEKIYFSRNTKTAIDVAHARGALVLLTIRHALTLREYGPLEIKKAVTGYGLADKKSVAKMIAATFRVPPIKGFDDVSDAIAVALTAVNIIPLDT